MLITCMSVSYILQDVLLHLISLKFNTNTLAMRNIRLYIITIIHEHHNVLFDILLSILYALLNVKMSQIL